MSAERWRQVEELFHAALQLEARERAAFLADRCAGDESVLSEVQSLLGFARNADSFLEAPLANVSKALEVLPNECLTGRRIGEYQILSLIGAGGMGTVYRARDMTLGRDVAFKVLPGFLSSDPQRVARFEREGRLLAALNHPHIGTIYGIREAEGIRGLVLELVEGSTLAERIADGPLPVRETLPIACQTAAALEAAHAKGIIHRDLKPANIVVTASGVAKVLDFGLAKVWSGEATGIDLSRLPTVTASGALEGSILGTPAYMSPEQARGKPLDNRTDIWSFGCVLFEMLTGRAPFAGTNLSDTVARVLDGEPDWQALPRSTPARVRHALRRCLQKDLNLRLREIADARIDLEKLLAGTADGLPTTVGARLSRLFAGWTRFRRDPPDR